MIGAVLLPDPVGDSDPLHVVPLPRRIESPATKPPLCVFTAANEFHGLALVPEPFEDAEQLT